MPEFTVRYAKKSELDRVNEIRYQVNRFIQTADLIYSEMISAMR